MTSTTTTARHLPALGRSAAVAAMVLSAACWGSATVMTKGALAALPPFTLLTLQLGASVAFLWAALLLARRRMRFDPMARRAALTGMLEPGFSYAAGVPGLALTTAASASIIGAGEPAFVALVAWLLLGERPGVRTALAIAAATAGVLLVSLPDAGTAGGSLAGDLLVLAGTLFAALYVVASSRFVAEVAPLSLAALQQTVGLLLALALACGAVLIGLERLPDAVPPAAILLALASGVVQYALAFWLYLLGLRVLPTSVAALFLTLIPVFGAGGAALFLGEAVPPAKWLGCAVVIAAVATIARHRA